MNLDSPHVLMYFAPKPQKGAAQMMKPPKGKPIKGKPPVKSGGKKVC
jgi:hypothetical protein